MSPKRRWDITPKNDIDDGRNRGQYLNREERTGSGIHQMLMRPMETRLTTGKLEVFEQGTTKMSFANLPCVALNHKGT